MPSIISNYCPAAPFSGSNDHRRCNLIFFPCLKFKSYKNNIWSRLCILFYVFQARSDSGNKRINCSAQYGSLRVLVEISHHEPLQKALLLRYSPGLFFKLLCSEHPPEELQVQDEVSIGTNVPRAARNSLWSGVLCRIRVLS